MASFCQFHFQTLHWLIVKKSFWFLHLIFEQETCCKEDLSQQLNLDRVQIYKTCDQLWSGIGDPKDELCFHAQSDYDRQTRSYRILTFWKVLALSVFKYIKRVVGKLSIKSHMSHFTMCYTQFDVLDKNFSNLVNHIVYILTTAQQWQVRVWQRS